MSSYEEVVQKDIQLMWSILTYCQQPWISEKMDMIISKNPMKDIVIIIWLFYVYGLVEVGAKHFWITVMNLIFAFGKIVFVCLCGLCVMWLFYERCEEVNRSQTTCGI